MKDMQTHVKKAEKSSRLDEIDQEILGVKDEIRAALADKNYAEICLMKLGGPSAVEDQIPSGKTSAVLADELAKKLDDHKSMAESLRAARARLEQRISRLRAAGFPHGQGGMGCFREDDVVDRPRIRHPRRC